MLMQELIRSQPDLKALGMSGYPVKDLAEELEAAGFLDVIRKPFEPDELAHVIRRALEP